MNVLFLTIGRMDDIEARAIYPDLLRQFRADGWNVFTVSPRERRTGLPTELVEKNGVKSLYVKIGNVKGCGMLEKAATTLTIGSRFKAAIRQYFADVKFDLILYSTPPITFNEIVESEKKRCGARTYLLLKDIFPQNAVDLGMFRKTGPKSFIYRYFRRKEKKLYAISDHIGCMSPANRDFLLKHNPEIPAEKVEISPNCVEPRDVSVAGEQKIALRQKLGLPTDKTIFVYGGNLGRPQGVPFIVDALKACVARADLSDAFFLLAGGGADERYLIDYLQTEKPQNVKFLGYVPKEEYDAAIACCDVGLIFLDRRFTIPNFPSRLLPYMQAELPVLACVDQNTDVGKTVVDGGFGWSCLSDAPENFAEAVRSALTTNDFAEMKANERRYLRENFDAAVVYRRNFARFRGDDRSK